MGEPSLRLRDIGGTFDFGGLLHKGFDSGKHQGLIKKPAFSQEEAGFLLPFQSRQFIDSMTGHE